MMIETQINKSCFLKDNID